MVTGNHAKCCRRLTHLNSGADVVESLSQVLAQQVSELAAGCVVRVI